MVDTLVPNRLHEGYGLNKSGYRKNKRKRDRLIITVRLWDFCNR